MIYGGEDEALVHLIKKCIDTGNLPPVLYRYRAFDDHTDSCLRDAKQWFSAPFAFNDPFDCQIQDNGEYTSEELKAYFLRAGAGEFWAEKIVERDEKEKKQMMRMALTKAKKKVMDGAGILCLSKRADSILMWSHYSRSHEGYVLGFDLLKDPLFFVAPQVVKYELDYPSFSYIRDPKKIVPNGMGTKAKEWEYEQEVRIIRPGSGLHNFKKECLTEVILGCRVTEANRDRMATLLGEPEYRHVDLKQAKVSETAFALKIESLTVGSKSIS